MAKEIKPNFQTQEADFCKEEKVKLAANMIRGNLRQDFCDPSHGDLEGDSEILAKSHGIYLEFNRAKTGKERDWMYMIRVSISGGGPITREHWRIFDELADDHTANPEGQPSLRATTRQNIQFHWVKKEGVLPLVSRVAESGFFSLNGCGDNTRNVMACPLSLFSTLYNANTWAQRVGDYFRLPMAPHVEIFGIDPNYVRSPNEPAGGDGHFQYSPQLLNRKFKIGFSAFHQDEATGHYRPDNCVELRTNDMGIAPILENGKVERFVVFVGGGQGERNGKPTLATLSVPLGVFEEKDLLRGLDAVVNVHQEWGDRQNRFWARLKYVIQAKGIEWYRDRVRERIGNCFELPDPNFDPGPRMLHHGWHRQQTNGLLAYGAFIENGRLIDDTNGQIKKMTRHFMDNYPVRLMITANQDLLFTDIPVDARKSFDSDLARFGYGRRNGAEYSALRRHSVACVGLPTCRLSYTESERFLPELMDQMEKMGWGKMAESIGISGCERQCSRPATKAIGWVGAGKDRYLLKLGGSEDARFQGEALLDTDGKPALNSVPRDQVAQVCAALLENFTQHRQEQETLGYFHRRLGIPAILEYLKLHSKTDALFKAKPTPVATEP